jgi:hypothetical protein
MSLLSLKINAQTVKIPRNLKPIQTNPHPTNSLDTIPSLRSPKLFHVEHSWNSEFVPHPKPAFEFPGAWGHPCFDSRILRLQRTRIEAKRQMKGLRLLAPGVK